VADYPLAVTRAASRAQHAVDLSLLALLLAAAVGFAWASVVTAHQWRHADRRYAQAVLLWRFGEPAVERLRHCMELAAAHTARESRVAVLVPGENLLVERWAAYYLATRTVIGGRGALPHADAAVTFGRVEPPAGAGEPLAGGPLCRVYRLRGGGESAPPPGGPPPHQVDREALGATVEEVPHHGRAVTRGARGALAAPLLLMLMAASAWVPARALAESWRDRLVIAAVGGHLLLHLLLLAYDRLGLRWSLAGTLGPLLLAALAGGIVALARRRSASMATDPTRSGDWHRLPPPGADRHSRPWGLAVAALVVAVFALSAAACWTALPDFVYHWGFKAHRFLLAGGVDWELLAAPESWSIHPDYPLLLPELFAVTAAFAGGWREAPILLWAPLHLALLLLAVDGALLAAPGAGPRGSGAARRQTALVVVALGLGTFALLQRMAGAADWLVALALVAAALPLLRPPDARGDWRVGICAALAAAAKIEGVPLAVALLVVQLGRGERSWPERARAATRLATPLVLVVAPWLARVLEHGLFQAFNSSAPSAARLLEALPPMLAAITSPSWCGLGLALLALPALLLAAPGSSTARVRPLATVIALQLAFYVWTMASTAMGGAPLVLAAFPRLLLHLLPAQWVALLVAWLPARDASGATPAA
jgi:hypothetical protein